MKTSFILISKKELTHDVYELIYSCADLMKESLKPGQYVLFQLAPGLSRAYSISTFKSDTFTLIIKRIPDGRGSPIICDAPIGACFTGLIPLGHFILQNTLRSKCFIGTGTGFAPLYCQMKASQYIENFEGIIAFIFGVRSERDIFYTPEIIGTGAEFRDFQYIQYISRPEHRDSLQGYVTDWITAENIENYEEYYLCGSPAMVKSAREKLQELGIEKQHIYWEQF